MNRDPLSDVLRSVRLRGAVYYYVSFRDDWVAQTPSAPELANALMPGAERVLAYHLIAKGDGWAATDGTPGAAGERRHRFLAAMPTCCRAHRECTRGTTTATGDS